ncbi:hypothetical protein CFTD6783_08400 [Campylobacter fetus subsp. testudinum]|uniref:hypothetical protein n=1 Tax=Campylobacter fetus TaxID=196 RepID=UPI000818A4AA|nr:hypothetical protein [Campylobacter fetus]OCS09377.1 hypothetical protein CFTD6783_08400 [Campylobacter fetus subsp. testudinum]
MSYQQTAELYDKRTECEDEATQEFIDRCYIKLRSIRTEYSDFFSEKDIKTLIGLLNKRDQSDKEKSDVCNVIYDLDSLAIELGERLQDPLLEMLDCDALK